MWFGTKSSINRRFRLRSRSRKPGQAGVSSKTIVYGIAGDRETGAGDVFLPQVRQCFLELAAPLGIRARDLLRPSPVCQTLRNQTQSKPISTRRSSSASGISSSVAERPSFRDSSVSQTRVLI